MFVVDGGNESGVMYVDQNVEKGDGSVGNSAGELEGRMKRLDRREKRVWLFIREQNHTGTVIVCEWSQ